MRNNLTDTQIKEFQEVIRHLPYEGIAITKAAASMNISPTTLYNYKNGLKPTEHKYKYILACLMRDYPEEMNRISVIMQYEKQLEKGE